jgi:hypothetical protein
MPLGVTLLNDVAECLTRKQPRVIVMFQTACSVGRRISSEGVCSCMYVCSFEPKPQPKMVGRPGNGREEKRVGPKPGELRALSATRARRDRRALLTLTIDLYAIVIRTPLYLACTHSLLTNILSLLLLSLWNILRCLHSNTQHLISLHLWTHIRRLHVDLLWLLLRKHIMAPVNVEPCAHKTEYLRRSGGLHGTCTRNIAHKTRELATIPPVEHRTRGKKLVPERTVEDHQKRQRLQLR